MESKYQPDHSDHDRVVKSLHWDHPNSLVVEGGFSPATWQRYREALEPIAARMPNDFGVYTGPGRDYDQMPPTYRKGDIYTDPWGCVWECRVDGMQGIIRRHPLEDWSGFDAYLPPDPDQTADLAPWDKASFEEGLKTLVEAGK